MDTKEAPLKWPLEGVGDSMSVGEAGAEMKLLSRDLDIYQHFNNIGIILSITVLYLELGGLGGSCAWALATSSHSSLLVYTMKLSSRRLSGAQEILPDLRRS